MDLQRVVSWYVFRDRNNRFRNSRSDQIIIMSRHSIGSNTDFHSMIIYDHSTNSEMSANFMIVDWRPK
jgi:hypothetical protein